jgi:hypothetical protein
MGEGVKMTKYLKRLLRFIKKYEPEIHYEKEREEKIIIFLYTFWIEDFVELVDIS